MVPTAWNEIAKNGRATFIKDEPRLLGGARVELTAVERVELGQETGREPLELACRVDRLLEAAGAEPGREAGVGAANTPEPARTPRSAAENSRENCFVDRVAPASER